MNNVKNLDNTVNKWMNDVPVDVVLGLATPVVS